MTGECKISYFECRFVLHNPPENGTFRYIYPFQVELQNFQHWLLVTGNKDFVNNNNNNNNNNNVK